MNLEKVLLVAQQDADMSAMYSFKMAPEQKEAFIALCEERGLSPGRVVREMIRQFIEGVQ